MNFFELYKQVKELEEDGYHVSARWFPGEGEYSNNEVVVNVIPALKGTEKVVEELRYLIRYELNLSYNTPWAYQVGSGTIRAFASKIFLRYSNQIYEKKENRFVVTEEIENEEILLREENAVYNYVRWAHDNGHTLRAEWEGGDDSRFIRILVDGEYSNRRNKRLDELCDSIQDQIYIPTNGDQHNIGGGTIYSDEQCVYIVTKFLSFLRYPEPEPEMDFPELKWELPGLDSCVEKLKRSALNATIILYPDKPHGNGFSIRVINGDSWELSQKQEKYLRAFLDEEAEKLKYLFAKDIGDYELSELVVSATIDHGLSSEVLFRPSFIKILERAEEELYILFEKKSYE